MTVDRERSADLLNYVLGCVFAVADSAPERLPEIEPFGHITAAESWGMTCGLLELITTLMRNRYAAEHPLADKAEFKFSVIDLHRPTPPDPGTAPAASTIAEYGSGDRVATMHAWFTAGEDVAGEALIHLTTIAASLVNSERQRIAIARS